MQWLVWILEGLLTVGYLLAGWPKLVGVEQQKKAFTEHYGYSLGMMRFIGAMELLGALGLLAGYRVPVLAALAAIGLAIIMAGAVWTHLRLHDALPVASAAGALLILDLILLAARLSLGL